MRIHTYSVITIKAVTNQIEPKPCTFALSIIGLARLCFSRLLLPRALGLEDGPHVVAEVIVVAEDSQQTRHKAIAIVGLPI